ncbi:MAG: methyltransferase domain-containing protein [Syntrophobacteraceae bacterium]
MKTDLKNFIDIEFALQWQSRHGKHCDLYFARRANLWRDLFHKRLLDELMDKSVGDSIELEFSDGELVPKPETPKLFTIRDNQFDKTFRSGESIEPRNGRFYPKGILKGIHNVFRANREPFRCARVADSSILVDFNHPLAGTRLHLKATIGNIETKHSKRAGGLSNDWMEIVTAGPGIQARWNGEPTDFLSDNPFARTDQTPDSRFYGSPRMVDHIDAAAIEGISRLYGELIPKGGKVLDLMSSWKSHIPTSLELDKVTGLGMNEEELKENTRLSDFVIHDLNQNPTLPFEDDSFDALICTVSVEYMTNPVPVFKEAARVLKTGSPFIVTFSNRWFPPKVVTIWSQILEFERMGLVAEYFELSEKFRDLNTLSTRGLPRPAEDKYFGQLQVSDPVYAVWAYRT